MMENTPASSRDPSPMSEHTEVLALPPRDPYPGPPFGWYRLPTNQSAGIWRLIQRYWRGLAVCAIVSLGLAYVAGKLLVQPLWQAEATLLYQPVALTEKQRAAYEHPPSLPTLAAWAKQPALIRKLIAEFRLKVSEAEFAEKYVKVEQPGGTESLMIAIKWPDPTLATNALGRLLELFSDYVVTARKEAVLLRIEKMDQQAAVGCEDEIKRLDTQIAALERKLAKTGKLSDDDLDGTMLARRASLQDDVRKLGHRLSEQKSELTFQRGNRAVLEPLVRQNAEPKAKLDALDQQIAQLELQIEHARESIDAAEEELRTLPIAMAKAKRYEQVDKLNWLKSQLAQHAVARAEIGRPGGPPARGALEGTDAREFSVESPPRAGDKPVSSGRKTLFAVTFLGLMAAALGLLSAHDRRHPPIDRGVIHVTPPPANAVDARRLANRMRHWVRDASGPLVTPPPTVAIDPDGTVDARDADAEAFASRMRQWLGDGQGPG
jgi:hypothetical protein